MSAPDELSAVPPAGRDPGIAGQLGKFALLERLGSGLTGVVYLAKDTDQSRLVALKVLLPRFQDDGTLTARLDGYVRGLQQVRSGHIARVLESGVTGAAYWVAAEWLEGASLTERLGRPAGQAVATSLLRQICSGLQAAHQHGIVHRDLKPENVFLTTTATHDEFVKVLDFGLAPMMLKQKPGSPRTPSGQLCGTPQYLAPEQCTGGVVDLRADLYALGVIGYELLTGRVPFDGRNPIQVMLRHRDERPVPPHELQPSVPRALSDVIMRALEKHPEDRWATAAELAEALRSAPMQAPPRTATADVRLPSGRTIAGAGCSQLFSGGLLLATAEEPPAVGTPLHIRLTIDGVPVECRAEVTTHVGASEAASLGTPAGFAARFTHVSHEAQGVIDRVLRGEPLLRAHPDRELDRLQRAVSRGKGQGNFYTLLGASSGADAGHIRRRARECRAKVEDALLQPCEPQTRARLERTLRRLEEAVRVLCSSVDRMAYDAARGNFRGIAAALEAGLDPELMGAARRRYGREHPTAIAAATAHAASSDAKRERGDLPGALSECELALTLDPLSAGLHVRRARLLFQLESQAGSLSGEWRMHQPAAEEGPRQRQVMGGTAASAEKTPPVPRSTAQLSPLVEPDGG